MKITLQDSEYPQRLRTIADPPPILYVKGTLLKEDEAAVAIVGTRRATPYGLETARRLASDLARAGVTVVSGLAEGIDAAAHRGALEVGGRTLAVLGHGLNTVYPPFHKELAEQVAHCGALISEFPMEGEPLAWNFPRRNRVISGLSLGVIVVEAPLRSGALITAREALEQGREVFAVPGPVTSPNSPGCHRLLKDGARLVEDARDVLEELELPLKSTLIGWRSSSKAQTLPDLSEEESAVYETIPVGSAVGAEAIAKAAATSPSRLLSVLTTLELKGLIRQMPGQGYSRLS